MCILFANLYVLLTWGSHMIYLGTPYIFDIYMIRCGWLGPYICQTISPCICIILVYARPMPDH